MKQPSMRGYSLISLMVGVLVSSLVALGMMSLFKTSAQSTAVARQDSVVDDKLVSGMLRAQIAAQDAGFGVDSAAYGSQVQVLSGAALAGGTLSGTAAAAGTAGNALVWAMNVGAGLQCAGLLFDNATDGTGGLKYLGPVNCTSASGWGSANWTSATWIGSSSASPAPALSFVVTAATCKPFGLSGLASGLSLTINGSSSAGIALADVQCLANFRT